MPKASCLLAIIACLASFAARAESVSWHGYSIEYTTFVSTIIPPDVARAHNIIRGDNRVIANITILRNGKPVTASIRGTVTNLLNQQSQIAFREVREKDAIYYLANQLIDARDTLRYSLFITPAGSQTSYHLQFTREYLGSGSP